MKKLAVVTLLLALPITARAADVPTLANGDAAAAPPTGITVLLEGYGGYNWASWGPPADDDPNINEVGTFGLFGGWVGANVPIGAFGFQFETFGEATSLLFAPPTDDSYVMTFGAGGHLYWRNPSAGLFGVMGGAVYSNTNTFAGDGGNQAIGWLAGLEAQAYLGKLTVYAQGGFADFPTSGAGADSDYPRDMLFARGAFRYFPTNNTGLEAELGGMWGTFDGGGGAIRIVNWALELEHAFGQGPLAVFARYEGFLVSDATDGQTELDNAVLVGFRFGFGGVGASPYLNDREGVGLDLPDLGRWGGLGNGVIE